MKNDENAVILRNVRSWRKARKLRARRVLVVEREPLLSPREEDEARRLFVRPPSLANSVL